MNPVRASLRYPQVTIALTIMLVASGAYALMRMPRREDPKIHVREGIVAVMYPGASAGEVENQVTQKIEQRLFKLEGVRREKTYSTSMNGAMYINLNLEDNLQDTEKDVYKRQRMKFLVERKSLPPNDFQKIEAAYNASKERYEMALEGTRKEDRAAATAQAHAADAQASEEGKRLNDTRLLAPISGSISMRRVDPGQTVAAGMAVFSIVDLNPVKVRVGVPEAEIGKVHQGATAEISVPSLDGRRFAGKVGIIGVAAEPTSRTYTCLLYTSSRAQT